VNIDPGDSPGRPLRAGEIEEQLRRLLPQARSLDLDSYDTQTGEFRARARVPTRAGEAQVTIRRYPLEGDAPADDPTDPQISKAQRMSISGAIMWGWYVDYDDAEISEDEVRTLIGRPLVRDPMLSYPREVHL